MSTEQTQITDSALDKLFALKTAATAERTIGDARLLVLPEDFHHVDITDAVEKAAPAPTRKRGSVALGNVESFVRYCKDQQFNAAGYVYADPDTYTITAVFNDQQGDAPGWRDFRATFKAEPTRELVIWLKNDRKTLEQEEFAVFLEDNIADIIEPSGGDLLQIALTLQAKIDVNFSSARRLDNGQVQLQYTETIDARAGSGAIEIPREFKIGMRLFKNAEAWSIKARFKYRLAAGKVKFWYELDRVQNTMDEAFSSYVTAVGAAGYPVLIGKP